MEVRSARIRLKGGGTHWVIGSKRIRAKGSREVRLLCLGPHESVGAAIAAWRADAAACRDEAASLERAFDTLARRLKLSPAQVRRGEVPTPAGDVRGAPAFARPGELPRPGAANIRRAVAHAEKLREHAEEVEAKIEKARRLPAVVPCRCGRARAVAPDKTLARLRLKLFWVWRRDRPPRPAAG